jgi:hypothetical protein
MKERTNLKKLSYVERLTTEQTNRLAELNKLIPQIQQKLKQTEQNKQTVPDKQTDSK